MCKPTYIYLELKACGSLSTYWKFTEMSSGNSSAFGVVTKYFIFNKELLYNIFPYIYNQEIQGSTVSDKDSLSPAEKTNFNACLIYFPDFRFIPITEF